MGKVSTPDTYEGWPVVTAAQMQELDGRAIKEFHIASTFLMERAGAGVAEETLRFAADKLGKSAGLRVSVCCGRGNNGGDGLVASRLLRGKGVEARAVILEAKKDRSYGPEVSENLAKARAAGVEVKEIGAVSDIPDGFFERADVLIDGLLGTGSSGKPAGLVKDVIQAMAKAGRPIVAIDLPSGLQPDTGYHTGVFLNAAVTVTLGLPKRGLLAAHAKKHVGALKVIDIGYPVELTKRTRPSNL